MEEYRNSSDAPLHVPKGLIRDLDIYNIPGMENGSTEDVHALWKKIQDTYPPVFWSSNHGGHWIATRFGEIERLLQEHETFSSAESTVPTIATVRLLPLQLDPPEHGAFRRLLMSAFSPAAIARATARTRQVAIEIIERIRSRGECEFVGEVVSVTAMTALIALIDLPEEDQPYLQRLATLRNNRLHPNFATAYAELLDYVRKQIVLRERAPRDDFISTMLKAKIAGRPITVDEVFSMCSLLVSGGTDTVVSMTSFATCFLAQNPSHRHELIDHPERLDSAVEEIARRFGVSNLARVVRRDTTLGSVSLHKGDRIVGLFPLAGLDEAMNADPMTVDFSRQRPRHFAFGTGPHVCAGKQLAKQEIKILLQEWLARIPDFRLASSKRPSVNTGVINSFVTLNLAWEFR